MKIHSVKLSKQVAQKLSKKLSNISAVFVLLVFLFATSIASISLPKSALAFAGSGSGTAQSPFMVSTCTQLQSIDTDGLANTTDGKLYKLASNIDCTDSTNWNSGAGFKPISNFEGTFDGAGYAIDGLTIDRASEDNIGLFASIGYDALVANFSLTNILLTGRNFVGSVVGQSGGMVYGINASGVVNGNSTYSSAGTGGIIGGQQNSGITVERLSFSGTVTNTGDNTGGIIGYTNNGRLSNSYVDADITGTYNVGGLLGNMFVSSNTLTNSYARGIVTGTDYVGGAIGKLEFINSTNIENIFSAAEVSSPGSNTGTVFSTETISGGGNTLAGLYFDDDVNFAALGCYAVAADPVSCTAINSDGLNPTYFFNSANAPLSSWDFTNIWQTNSSSYPTLRAVGTLTGPTVPQSLIAIQQGAVNDMHITWNAPSSIGTFGVSNYKVEVKKASDTWDILYQNSSTDQLSYDVESLLLGTSYDIRVKAISSYAPSDWATFTYTTPPATVRDVSTCQELQDTNDNTDGQLDTITLSQDIDCTGFVFTSLGRDGSWGNNGYFAGIFDGQGHTITNLTISGNDYQVGLFYGVIYGTVKDVTFDGGDIQGSDSVGTVAGYAEDAQFSNIRSSTTVAATNGNAGGIVGYAEYYHDASFDGLVFTGDVSGSYAVGGLFGEFDAYDPGTNIVLEKSYSQGSVTAVDNDRAGGLIGKAYTESEDDDDMPETSITLQDVYSTADVSAVYIAGGLIGEAEAYNDGYETLSSIYINRAYASGSVTALYNNAGGIIGSMSQPEYNGEQYVLNDVFATGSVSASSYAFALIGSDNELGDGLLDINNSYFDQTATGQTEATAYDSEVDGWTAVNTNGSDGNYFKSNNANAPLNAWNFTTIWRIQANGYPILRIGDNSVSFISPQTNKIIKLQLSAECTFEALFKKELDQNAPNDIAYDYPNGLVGFNANCGTPGFTTTVTQYYYGVTPGSVTVRKYNPATKTYFTITDAVLEQVTLEGQPATKVTYTVKDGSNRDADGIEDGNITDPAGLAVNVVGVPNTGLGGKK